jgi:hypothetical protein
MARSNLFKNLDVEEKEENGMNDLSNDLIACRLLEETKIDAFFEDFYSTITNGDIKAETLSKKTIQEKYHLEERKYDQIDTVINYYIGYFTSDDDAKKDNVDDICADMVEYEMINKKDIDFYKKFITEIHNHSFSDWYLKIRQIKTTNRTSPKLKDIRTCIEYRAVFDSDNDFDDLGKIDKPKCIGVVPIVTFQLNLSNTHLDKIVFQVEIEELERIKTIIERTIDEFNASKSYLKVE